MDKDLRVSLVAAGSAVTLSALVGLVAGVGFLTLVFRASIGGFFIGAAVYGGVLLLRSLVPGLVHGGEEAVDVDALSGDEPEKGSLVDIVLPGEAPSPESFADEEDRSAASARRPMVRASPVPFSTGRDYENPARDEEAAELSPIDEPSLLDPEFGDAEAAAAMPVGANLDKGRRPSAGFEDLDVLPDLEGFSDSFTASEFSSGGSSAANSPSKSYASQGSSGSRLGQEGLDPASLAQAVRTILKRDQKG